MQLAIFDIDGTLTHSTGIDDSCYLRAIHDVFGIEIIDQDWDDFQNPTDPGIAIEMLQRAGREPVEAELLSIRERFLGLLKEAHAADTSLLRAKRGALDLLDHLQCVNDADWHLAIATGGWRCTAIYKLTKIGLEPDGIPAAFADDGLHKRHLIPIAIARARATYAADQFDRIVYVGDSLHDLNACAELGIPFIGIGEPNADKLRASGASHCLVDYVDRHRCMEALRLAAIPTRANTPGWLRPDKPALSSPR